MEMALYSSYTPIHCGSRLQGSLEKDLKTPNRRGTLPFALFRRCGEIPKGYPFYLWNKEDGYKNHGRLDRGGSEGSWEIGRPDS